MRDVSPCRKDCPRRGAGCTASCEPWKAYERERNAGYERRRKALDLSYLTAGGVSNCRRTERARKNGREHLK